MKRLLLPLLMLLLLLPLSAAHAENGEGDEERIDEGISSWLEKIELGGLEDAFSALPGEIQAVFGSGGLTKRIADAAQAAGGLDGEALSLDMKAFFLRLVKDGVGKLLFLLGAALFSAVVAALYDGGEKGVGGTAAFVIRCMALAGTVSLYLSVVSSCAERMRGTVSFLEAAFPALVTLLTAVGGTASIAALQPSFAFLIGTVLTTLEGVVLPLSVLSGILGMMDPLFEKKRLSEMSKFTSKTAKWIMGAITVAFVGTLSVKSLAAVTFDSISIKYFKYAAQSLVPIVGGMVSGTMDTVLGCATLVKCGAGVTALSVIGVSVAYEILRVLSAAFMLRLASALSEPVAEKRIIQMYAAASDSLNTVLAVVIAFSVALMAFVGVAALIGNVSFLA